MKKLTKNLKELDEQIYILEQHYQNKLKKDPIYIKLLEQRKNLKDIKELPKLVSLLSKTFPDFTWGYDNHDENSNFTHFILGNHVNKRVEFKILCNTELTRMGLSIDFHLGVPATLDLNNYIVSVPELVESLKKLLTLHFPAL